MSSEPAARGSLTTRAQIREIFAQDGFRRILAARVVSQMGDGVFQLSAAAVLLFEHPGANPVLDLLGITVITLIPFSAIAPFTGVFIDRWERHKILTRVPLLRAGVAALLPLAAMAGENSVAFYAVVLFVLSANRFFLATMSAVLPELVPPGDLLVANSAATTGGAIASVVGQGIGAALSSAFGGVRTATIAALAFTASAWAANRVPAPRALQVHREPLLEELREVMSELREGMRALVRSPRVVYGLSAIAAVQVLIGALVGVLIFFFIRTLGLKVGSATGVLAVLAVGIGIGVVGVPAVARRVRHDVLIPIAFLIAAVGTALSGIVLTRATMIAGAGIAGVSYAFAKIPVDTIVQQEMPNVVRGRAFAVYDMVFNVARVTGITIVAFCYEAAISSRVIIAVVAGCYGVLAVIYGGWTRRRSVQAQAARTAHA